MSFFVGLFFSFPFFVLDSPISGILFSRYPTGD